MYLVNKVSYIHVDDWLNWRFSEHWLYRIVCCCS